MVRSFSEEGNSGVKSGERSKRKQHERHGNKLVDFMSGGHSHSQHTPVTL